MFFRDELLSWFGRRPLGMPIPPVGGIATLNSAELKDKVNSNVKDVIGRIRGIAPQYFSEEVNLLPASSFIIISLCKEETF